MYRIKEILKLVENHEKDHEYLELGFVSHELIYILQKLRNEEWEKLYNSLYEMNCLQRMILVDAIFEINDNKASDFDTSLIFAQTFLLSEFIDSEVLIEKMCFLDNGNPKEIKLIDEINNKTKWLEKQKLNYRINFEEKYELLYKLYNNAIC